MVVLEEVAAKGVNIEEVKVVVIAGKLTVEEREVIIMVVLKRVMAKGLNIKEVKVVTVREATV